MNSYKPNGQTKDTYTHKNGTEQALPTYYRNKAYTDQEKELLWLEKLDKQERWILGQKVDVSKSFEDYWKALEYARKKNKRLGYGDNRINWNQKEYEEQIRAIKQATRKGEAPSARSLAKGLGLNITPLTDIDTSHLEGGHKLFIQT